MSRIEAGKRLLLSAVALGLMAAPVRAQGFPEVDRSKLKITLERSACLGSCPDYRVTIDGAGRVVFDTGAPAHGVAAIHREFSFWSGVLVEGRHEDKAEPAAVDALVEQFRAANFFALKDEYETFITDQSGYAVSIDTGHGTKRVYDYVGRQAGMPEAVTRLEEEIDRVAGSARWVSGADGLVDWLARTAFDFHSREAARLVLHGMERADEATLIALIARGAPLEAEGDRPVAGLAAKAPGREPAPLFGMSAMRGAIYAGRPRVFEQLVALGWLKRLKPGEAGNVFAQSDGACDPAFIDMAAKAGIDIDAPLVPKKGPDDDWFDHLGKSALANLGFRGRNYDCADDAALVASARLLLMLGADPNRRDSFGETAIFGVENLDLLNLLLAHGADAAAKDDAGLSAAFFTWKDDITLRLLKAGASPEGRDADGHTLVDQAKAHNMPRAAAWLKAHGAK